MTHDHADLPTRRGFGRELAAGGILALTGGARADEPKKAPAVVDALLTIVRARYGKHLTTKQLDAIHASLKRGVKRALDVKKVPLTNADDPALAFRADLP